MTEGDIGKKAGEAAGGEVAGAPAQKAAEKKQRVQEQAAQVQPSDDSYKERLLRLAAEFDNYKKRISIEMQNAKSVGKAEFVRALLPALDEFELAIVALGGGERAEGMLKGFGMVYSNMQETLRRQGLREIAAKGVFDPYLHEIVTVREDYKKPPGTILEVIKKGYTVDSIMVRPAAVIIAKAPEAGGTGDGEGEAKSEKK